jgi:lipopolysaccharide transport protein LptA
MAGATLEDLERLAADASRLDQALPDSAPREARSAARQLEEVARESGGDGPFSLGGFDRDAPVVIRADELEATEQDGRRVLQFRRNVEVRQGSLELRATRLSAVYPAGAKQPSRLEASGGVSVREGSREARCDRVVYDRPARSLDCLGQAALRDGVDSVSGESIRFDLASRSVTIGGGTEVWFEPRDDADGDGLPAGVPLLRERSPVRVRAARLNASDDESGRRIAFEGDVELSQQDTRLSAQRLEAVYPPGSSQPDRLVATGEVWLAEGSREARCARAEFLRLENRVRCEVGVARADEDRLEGDLIEFALGEERLSVRGRTRLVLAPRESRRATP